MSILHLLACYLGGKSLRLTFLRTEPKALAVIALPPSEYLSCAPASGAEGASCVLDRRDDCCIRKVAKDSLNEVVAIEDLLEL